MNREKVEELRERLLTNEGVNKMIAMRAYEIYQQRGGRPGNPAEDWLRAESEVLAYLIEQEAGQIGTVAGGWSATSNIKTESPTTLQMDDTRAEGPRAFKPQTPAESEDRLGGASSQTAEEVAQSQSALGTWSPAEPASEERAPSIGQATGSLDSRATPKKRAASKSTAAPRPRKEAAPKSEGAKKPAAKRSASKKSTGKKKE